ncbi:hypothetical protein EDD85DRAFT_938802 [Armillaria nabsnona]|nr:hypothetical protein EDD85DRAFT_938802 [Armillaria nabsnona]
MEIITKSKAKETYKLNDRDLDSFPYEQQLAVSGFKMKRRISLSTLPKATTKLAGRDILGEREENEARKNRKVLTDCLTLWVPDYVETPASYEPPTFECTKPSLPNNFAMRPGSRPITELEAMNLFLRTMDCHGGFNEHNRKILDLSNEAASKFYWDWRTFPEDLMIQFAVSPIELKNKCSKNELDGKAFLEVWWPPYDPIGDQFTCTVCAPGHYDGCRMEDAPDLVV